MEHVTQGVRWEPHNQSSVPPAHSATDLDSDWSKRCLHKEGGERKPPLDTSSPPSIYWSVLNVQGRRMPFVNGPYFKVSSSNVPGLSMKLNCLYIPTLASLLLWAWGLVHLWYCFCSWNQLSFRNCFPYTTSYPGAITPDTLLSCLDHENKISLTARDPSNHNIVL